MTESGTRDAPSTQRQTTGHRWYHRRSRTYLGEGFDYGYNVPRAVLCVLGVFGLAAILTGTTWAMVVGGICAVCAITGLFAISLRRRRTRATPRQRRPGS
ncbi:hypothetical protein [Nocardia sp. BMG51109]|uniref:hypothetical protein n=1 Tax=Nocardia sp. BMG51109 TaxID=1056816 RepID=UPI0004648A26|nr:hypothetical protein [Nocardia sp. BMG51109]